MEQLAAEFEWKDTSVAQALVDLAKMGLIKKERRGRRVSKPRVEVRVDRRGRALHVDGSFASWYTPGLATTGSVWDALAAPISQAAPYCRPISPMPH